MWLAVLFAALSGLVAVAMGAMAAHMVKGALAAYFCQVDCHSGGLPYKAV